MDPSPSPSPSPSEGGAIGEKEGEEGNKVANEALSNIKLSNPCFYSRERRKAGVSRASMNGGDGGKSVKKKRR